MDGYVNCVFWFFFLLFSFEWEFLNYILLELTENQLVLKVLVFQFNERKMLINKLIRVRECFNKIFSRATNYY